MEWVGYLSAVLVGFTLGIIGGGGSILTVPILVYLLGFNEVIGTAYSLFIVGISSLIGAYSYMRKGLLNYRAAIIFAIPSMIAVFLTRKFLVPAIPEQVFTLGDFIVTKGVLIMVLFALVMILAAISMIHKPRIREKENGEPDFHYGWIMAEGALVGVLTGIVGAGGGFLIIPALVLLARLPMKLAVGTSLLIIAIKSIFGFLGDVTEQNIDWQFLLAFTGFAIVGIFIGSYISRFVPGVKLQKAFGWFVLLMGVYIIINEVFI